MKKKNVALAIKPLMLLLVVIMAVACNDDEPTKSKTDLLTSKSWKWSKIEIKLNGSTIDVTEEFLQDCLKDELLTFSKDGSYTITVGADDCNGDRTNSSGTWSWTQNETVLNLQSTVGDPQEFPVVELSSTTLKLNDSEEISFDSDGDGTDDIEIIPILVFKNN